MKIQDQESSVSSIYNGRVGRKTLPVTCSDPYCVGTDGGRLTELKKKEKQRFSPKLAKFKAAHWWQSINIVGVDEFLGRVTRQKVLGLGGTEHGTWQAGRA